MALFRFAFGSTRLLTRGPNFQGPELCHALLQALDLTLQRLAFDLALTLDQLGSVFGLVTLAGQFSLGLRACLGFGLYQGQQFSLACCERSLCLVSRGDTLDLGSPWGALPVGPR